MNRACMMFAVLALGGSAFAQEAPPKPDAALQNYKDMIGSWKCEGTMNMGGQKIPAKTSAKFSWDEDNFWVVGKFEAAKTKGMPQYKGTAYYGYDTGKKTFVSMGIDNMGGYNMATSKGREGDTEVWTGKANMMGKEADNKMTINYKGKNEVQIVESIGPAGPEGYSSDMTCKK